MENWRNVVGWEGVYEVSDLGRIRSLHTGAIRKTPAHPRLGYNFVTMKAAGRKQRTATVHTLVCEAFIGPRPAAHDICHFDGDRTNNRLQNLRYGTRSENIQDTQKHGRLPSGEKHYGSKLTEADVLSIRADRRGSRRLARIYPVCRQSIDAVKAGKTWAGVTPPGGG